MGVSVPPSLRVLALKAKLRRMAMDRKPILVGPWRSEVGFEVLYWIPLLNWIAKQVPGFAERAYVLSRGGAGAWYGTFAPPPRELDLYHLRTLDDFRVANNDDQLATGLQKQTRITSWDRAVLKDAAAKMGLADYHVLHPSWMYWALEPWWEDQVGLKHIAPLLEFPQVPAPALPEGLELPTQFVAVKLYHRATFPDNPMTREFCGNLLKRVTSQMPVVLLHQPSLHADDHHDIPLQGPNIYHLPAFPPERNLEYLSAVLGRASAFIGTYGGVSQLALRMGIRSVSFYTSFQGTARAHLTLSQAMAAATGVPYVVMSISEVGLSKLALREKVVEKVVEKVA